MGKPNTAIEQKQLIFIVETMKQGKTYKESMAMFADVWRISPRTFDRRWQKATQEFREAQKSIEIQKQAQYAAAEIERQKSLVLSREKVMEMTSNVLKIAYNNVATKKDDKSIASFATAKAAYTKLCGMDLPDKIANTDSEGNDIIEIGDPTPLFVSAN